MLYKEAELQKVFVRKKLAVVDYYQTNDKGVAKVGTKFDLNPS